MDDISSAETYAQMSKAIAFMRQHQCQQPSLAEIAQQVHLSEYHFQRRFTRWAGVSPKRFMQFLTVEQAKAKIARSPNLLELSAEVGLSSPGRLHDLFIHLEAMSPGEYKQQGQGLTIEYGVHDTSFGCLSVAQTERGICSLQFLDSAVDAEATVQQMLRSQWPQATLRFTPETTQAIAQPLFTQSAQRPQQPIHLWVKGTNFQIQVWRALLKIPLGHCATYGQLATALGKPTAARAVGNAVGKNPIAYLIPCHRVIRESGALGGYRWGGNRKAALLGWEAAQQEPAFREAQS